MEKLTVHIGQLAKLVRTTGLVILKAECVMKMMVTNVDKKNKILAFKIRLEILSENGLDVQTTCQGGESNINVVSAPELTRTSRVVILKASDVPIMDSPPNHHPKIVLRFYWTVKIGRNGPNSWESFKRWDFVFTPMRN